MTPLMTVPIAAMNKNYSPVFWQDDVRPSRKVLDMQAESESGPMKKPSDDHFGLRILPSYGRHHAAASGLVYDIRHETI